METWTIRRHIRRIAKRCATDLPAAGPCRMNGSEPAREELAVMFFTRTPCFKVLVRAVGLMITAAVALTSVGGGSPSYGQTVKPEPAAGASKPGPRAAAPRYAKNVVLFIGDAGGIPTLHAASLVRYQKPNGLFIHTLPHIALSDTSAADVWVTDSAAGMSAIVTGQKTNNGVLSMSAGSVRGKSDGEVLKTILEYAEERGLSTGVLSNVPVIDATAAACYSHANDRKMAAGVFQQFLSPRFGDGVEVIAGPGRQQIIAALTPLGMDLEASLKGKGYTYCPTPESIPSDARRVAALFDTLDFDQPLVVRRTIDILSKNPKGFFLMVEVDMHTDKLKIGLDHAIVMDQIVRETAERMKNDTLIIYTADHSFDIRVRGGKRGDSLMPEEPAPGAAPNPKPNLRVDAGHTGEQVLVAARGPGAERVRGFIENADIFRIMMAAFGWKETPSSDKLTATH